MMSYLIITTAIIMVIGESFVRPLDGLATQRKKRGNRNVNVNGNDEDWNVESVITIY